MARDFFLFSLRSRAILSIVWHSQFELNDEIQEREVYSQQKDWNWIIFSKRCQC